VSAHFDRADPSYDALKKLFPSNPLDPTYHSTQQESDSLLPTHRTSSDKYASPEEFRIALDREKNKVAEFYSSKLAELRKGYLTVVEEITALEDRELGGEDTIKEEPEDEEDDAEEGDMEEGGLLTRRDSQQRSSPRRPTARSRTSMFGRLGGWGSRRKSFMPTTGHETDLVEASIPPMLRQAGRSRSMSQSNHSLSASGYDDPANKAKNPRRSSDLESDDAAAAGEHVRRPSTSSNSSHERDAFYPRRKLQALGLVEMDVDTADMPEPEQEEEVEEGRPVFVWTGNNDHATVMRIGFKKRISAVWLEAYALKQYVELNLTAFEKILKK
jgi:phosphate transporter